MIRQIRDTSQKATIIRNIGPTEPLIDPEVVARALGAEIVGTRALGVQSKEAIPPFNVAAVRAELYRRIKSNGGRPALAGTDRRAKIPITDKQWHDLERLAKRLSSDEFSPSAGQVASVLLSSALRCVGNGRSGKK